MQSPEQQVQALSRFAVFSTTPPEGLAQIAAACSWRTFKAGQLIIGHQDRSHDVVFLVAGKARASVYSASGKQVSFRDIADGGLFGELAAIDNQPRSASIEALTDATAMVMPQPVFHRLLAEHPDFMMGVMRHLTAMVRGLTDRVVEFSTLAVKNRIHAELIRLVGPAADRTGDAVLSPAPTHLDIANRIATHREAVTRELNRLEELGVVVKEGRTLRIRNVQMLKAMIEASEADS
ncbi:MAG: Crp/Fnr family transcriptional regulator [Hyphomicrobiales bacterium]